MILHLYLRKNGSELNSRVLGPGQLWVVALNDDDDDDDDDDDYYYYYYY